MSIADDYAIQAKQNGGLANSSTGEKLLGFGNILN